MKRREFIAKCGAGLAGIITAGKAPAAIVKSLVGVRIEEERKSDGNPYQTSDNSLIKHFDAEWNDSIGVHNNIDYWRNLAAEDVELEYINNFNPGRVCLKMNDTYIEYFSSQRTSGFKIFDDSESPLAFTAIYAVSDNNQWINCSEYNNFIFGKPPDNPSVCRLRVANWTYNIVIKNTAMSRVNSMAFFISPDEFGCFNPQTLKWQTQSKKAYSLPAWGIGNLYNQGLFPREGSKFHSICVYNRILTEKELMKIDALNVKRFGQNTTLGFAL